LSQTSLTRLKSEKNCRVFFIFLRLQLALDFQDLTWGDFSQFDETHNLFHIYIDKENDDKPTLNIQEGWLSTSLEFDGI